MKRTIAFCAAAALSLTLGTAGCSGGGGSVHEATNAKVAGKWQDVSGTVLNGIGNGYGTPTWLDLDVSGTGSLFVRMPLHGLGCASGVFTVLGDTVMSFQTPSLGAFYFIYSVKGDSLTLTDPVGNVSTFTRQTAIPPADTCQALPVTTPIPLPIFALPSSRTSIGSDGTNLRFTNDAETAVVSFNPVTLTVGAAILTPSSFKYVIAMQDTDYWADCFCGGSPDVGRLTPAGVLADSFDTSLDPINEEISIRAGTWDGAHLWIAGGGFNGYTVEEIDSEAEPDTLVTTFETDGDVAGMAFKDSKLYVIMRSFGYALAELDPSTGDVNATYAIPFVDGYVGLAVAGGSLYAVAEEPDGTYVVLKLDGV